MKPHSVFRVYDIRGLLMPRVWRPASNASRLLTASGLCAGMVVGSSSMLSAPGGSWTGSVGVVLVVVPRSSQRPRCRWIVQRRGFHAGLLLAAAAWLAWVSPRCASADSASPTSFQQSSTCGPVAGYGGEAPAPVGAIAGICVMSRRFARMNRSRGRRGQYCGQ